MNKVNDIVLYGTEGVCTITEITEKKIGAKRLEYYALQPILDKNATIFLPVHNVETSGKLRPLLSEEEIYALIQTIPDECTIWIDDEPCRKERYKEILAEGDRTMLIRLIKTLQLRSQELRVKGKKLYTADERLMKDAEKILCDEFTYVLSLKREQVIALIHQQIEIGQRKEKPSMVFNPGDYVICAGGGVWHVTDIEGDEIRLIEHGNGAEKRVSAGTREIIRKIVSKKEILEAIDRIGFIPAIQAPNNKVRREFYDEAMAKYDEIEWIKVIKSVYLRKQAGHLMPSEATYGEKAEGFLHGEISVLLGIPINEVESYIDSAVSDSW